MVRKISDRKSHSDYVLSIVYHLHGKPIRFELNREEPGNGEKIKKM
jgi:hypothetical protein